MPSERPDTSEPESGSPEPTPLTDAALQGDPAPSDAGAPQTLGILFTAAALGLVVLLAVVGLIAFAAMSR